MDAVIALYTSILQAPHRPTRRHNKVRTGIIARSLRTRIHKDIRRIFARRLASETNIDGSITIFALIPTIPQDDHDTSNAPDRSIPKEVWDRTGGKYLHFTLYKENKDTMECVSYLAKCLRVGNRDFEFAGTKDRRAVTAQRVSVYRQTIDRMTDIG